MKKHTRALLFCVLLLFVPAISAAGVQLDSFWITYVVPAGLVIASATWASLEDSDDAVASRPAPEEPTPRSTDPAPPRPRPRSETPERPRRSA